MESSFTGKDLGMLLHSKLNRIQQYALVTTAANCILSCTNKYIGVQGKGFTSVLLSRLHPSPVLSSPVKNRLTHWRKSCERPQRLTGKLSTRCLGNLTAEFSLPERMEGEGKVVGMGWGGTAAVSSYLMRRYREDKVRFISASCSRTRANGHKLQQEKLTSSSPL